MCGMRAVRAAASDRPACTQSKCTHALEQRAHHAPLTYDSLLMFLNPVHSTCTAIMLSLRHKFSNSGIGRAPLCLLFPSYACLTCMHACVILVLLICYFCVTRRVAASPDGDYLLVSWLTRPFSTAVPAGRFPVQLELWGRSGTPLRTIAALPLAEDIPIAFNSCRKGVEQSRDRD